MIETAFTSIRFICSGDEYFNAVIQEIDRAQKEVQIESYIFEVDSVGKKILEALGNSVNRGVSVRLMVDGIGSYSEILSLKEICLSKGIQFRVYRAIPYINVLLRQFTRIFRTLNRRNHRKIIIVDQKKAFVGSYNITKVHSESIYGKAAWKDLAVLVEGPEVEKISMLASVYWLRFPFSTVNRYPRIQLNRVRSTHSIRSRRQSNQLLLNRIKNANDRVLVLTPYFVPSRKVIRALITAARKNVRVEIVMPDRSDFPIVDLAGRYVLRRLLKYKIDVYQYSHSFMHAKSLVIDAWATLGSHNLNHRSLVHDLEMDVTLETSEELQPLLKYWNSLKFSSRPVLSSDLDRDTFLIRMLCRFSFWFKNWL